MLLYALACSHLACFSKLVALYLIFSSYLIAKQLIQRQDAQSYQVKLLNSKSGDKGLHKTGC